MSRKDRKRSPSSPPTGQPQSWLRRHVFSLSMSLVIAAFVVGFYWFTHRSDASNVAVPAPIAATVQKAFTLDKLLAMTPEQLKDVDIAEMNLLCASGLPGAEKLDVAKCLARLDEWAAHVRAETEHHLYRAHDPRWAEHYKNSENWVRAEMLAQVLNEDCGVRYNLARIRDIDFRNSKDLLIHGMIDDPNGGTCASMPALYLAVGRRLGYPLKMVTTKGHVFVRWDDGKERFNIDTTTDGGTNSHPDDYYKEWPEKITDAEVKAGRYLVSLSPAEELATFLANRGHCLLDNGHAKEAFDAYAAAHRLAPLDPAYSGWMRQAEARFRPPTYSGIDPQGYRQPRPPYVQQPGLPQPYQRPTPSMPRRP